MKRGLQVVLGVMSLIPLYFGVTNLFGGAGQFLTADAVNAAIDSQFRFQSAVYLSLVALIWWIVPRIDQQTTLFRIITVSVFVGGLARLYSYFTLGTPPPSMFAGMILELGIPFLIVWQALIRTDNT